MNRRGVLLVLAGAGCAAGLGVFARPRTAFGFGPVRIGMAQDAALKALGPAAFRTALCRGVDGALFDWPDGSFRTPGDAAVPVMAMFGGADGAVSEIEASVSFPDGGWTLEDWHGLVAAQVAELDRRAGTDAAVTEGHEDDLGARHSLVWRRAEGELSLAAHWMRRSGAAFSRMHWIAAGEESVIA